MSASEPIGNVRGLDEMMTSFGYVLLGSLDDLTKQIFAHALDDPWIFSRAFHRVRLARAYVARPAHTVAVSMHAYSSSAVFELARSPVWPYANMVTLYP